MINVDNLSVSFNGKKVVNDVSFSIDRGDIVGIVGESGSGKSITSLTLMGLLSEKARIESGTILFGNTYLLKDGEKAEESLIKSYQGSRMSMVFQEPMTSLNPTMKVGKQVAEVLRLHTDLNRDEIYKRVINIFSEVGLRRVEEVYDSYPHQLSGGMRQRVMIAMALILEPELIIADEPTTALDVTIQAQIIELIKEINKKHDNSILFITHDLNLARTLATKIIVMRDGCIVEMKDTEDIFENPSHEYTKKLINAVPGRKNKEFEVEVGDNLTSNENKVLSVKNLNVFYRENNSMIFGKSKKKKVVSNASFDIYKGEVLGLVGESGCGKSSLSKAILGLNGNIEGEISHYSSRPQMIFQDPYSSLNPCKTIGWLLEEPLRVSKNNNMNKDEIRQAALEMLKKVGLDESYYTRMPSELSGGQRQRISIGQALITKPALVIADEPVSALDVTIQAQIMELMMSLKEEMNLSYLFISHDINIVYEISDRIMVMKDGVIIEEGDKNQVFSSPRDPYTKMLLA